MELPSTGEQFNLKWNNHTANFVQVFIEHQNQESLVDVTLSCEGQYVKAHKLVLSACSDYFHSIFQIHNSVPQPFILLNGVRFCDLKYILHFVYHGEVKVLDKDLPSVLALGQTLQIKGLSSVKLKDVSEEQDHSNEEVKDCHTPFQSSNLPLPAEVPEIYSPSNHICIQNSNVQLTKNKLDDYINCEEDTVPQPVEVYKSPTLVYIGKKRKVESTTETNGEHLQITSDTENNDQLSIKGTESFKIEHYMKNKIPKPSNAFMIFASDWRQKLAAEHPEETNKEISIRLGNMWKSALPEMKNTYYNAAKKAAAEHLLKYPDYTTCPSEVKKKRKSDDFSESSSPLDPLMMVEVDENNSICVSEVD